MRILFDSGHGHGEGHNVIQVQVTVRLDSRLQAFLESLVKDQAKLQEIADKLRTLTAAEKGADDRAQGALDTAQGHQAT